MMSASKIVLRPRRKRDTNKTVEEMSKEVSPDSKCPICLDIFNNMSYLDLCLHKFCFRCIHEWSKNKAECPLCKQPFNSIYHSIKSDNDFKKYDLRPTENGSFGGFGGARRFRYHSTMTGVRQRAWERTFSPPDSGVMFENWVDPDPQQERAITRMMSRLAARRRAASEGRAVRRVREQEIIIFRRELYRQGVRVQSVEDGGRSRDTTAEFYQRNPACLHRLVPWLKRELTVLYGAHGSLVNIVQHVVMSRITRFDLGGGEIQEELRPFLQARTEHFLHEFISFAKSPFNMEAYDHHAVYDCPDSLFNEDSSSNSSVIAISEDDEISVDLDTLGESVSSGALSQSVWDDETPGPSYSTTEDRNKVQRVSVPDSDSSAEEEDQGCTAALYQRGSSKQMDAADSIVKKDGSFSSSDDNGGDEDDCVIVGFVKPRAQRTPELVQLTSDSEESVHEEAKVKPYLPQHIRFTSPGSSPPPAAETNHCCAPGPSSCSSDKKHKHVASKEGSSRSASRREEFSSRSHRKSDYGKYSKSCYSVERSSERRRSRSRNRVRKRRSRSARGSSRSPVMSRKSTITPSRGSGHSRSSSRDHSHSNWHTEGGKRDSSREVPSHSYQWQSYSHYNQERDDRWIRYTERTTYYSSCHSNRDPRSHSCSRSCSRESHYSGHRGYSRSRTYSTSCSPPSKKSSNQEKPGGKRKYKVRHLEEPDKSTEFKSASGPDSPTMNTTSKKKNIEKHKSSKERSGKRCSVLSGEIDDAGNGSDGGKKQHKKKKKHKKKSKKHKRKERSGKRSPTVITIESDSGNSAYGGGVPSRKENFNSTTGIPEETLATSLGIDVPKSNSPPSGNLLRSDEE